VVWFSPIRRCARIVKRRPARPRLCVYASTRPHSGPPGKRTSGETANIGNMIPMGQLAGSLPCSSGVGSRSGFCPVAMSIIDLASWLGSLGRLGWLVIGTFHASLLIGADLYIAGPSVESVRHGGADGRHLIPENNRHCRCNDDGSRDDGHCHGVVHPAEYALRSTRFPARKSATIKLTHYPGRAGVWGG
jgi:hypothetical protein